MKRLFIIFLLLVSITGVAQVTPVKTVRVADATTTFNQNIVKGTQVYDVDADVLWIANKGVISTATLTSAASSFSALSNWNGTGNYIYPKTLTDSVGIGVNNPAAALDIVGRIEMNNGGGSVFIGDAAGNLDDASTNYNTAIGVNSGRVITSGTKNIGLGYNSLYSLDDGNYNMALGESALYSCVSGNSNTAIGREALYLNTGAGTNTAIGAQALYDNVTGINNMAFGVQSLYNSLGSANTSIGVAGLYYMVNGDQNVSIGNNAGRYYGTSSEHYNIESDTSIFIGVGSRAKVSAGENEIVIGGHTYGNGSRTVTIGNENITDVYLADTGFAKLHCMDIKAHGDIVVTGGIVAGSDITATGDIEAAGTIIAGESIHLFHYFGDSTVTFNYTTSWQHLTNEGDSLFIQDENDGFTVSGDTITVTNAGHYDIRAKIVLSADNGETVSFRAYNITAPAGIPVAGATTGRGDNNYGSLTIDAYGSVSSGDKIILQLKADGAGTAVIKNGIIKIFLIHN